MKGLTVNCVRPGFIETELTSGYADRAQRMTQRIPARRLGRPEEVAAVVEFLLSEAAAYVNGASIDVDGGLASTLGVP
jgi:3-oxoacyl-[acyl-carrier protein] reductase